MSNSVNSSTDKYIILMAGGSGSRMKAGMPKQLLDIGDMPMMTHVLFQANACNIDVVLVLSNKNKDIIINTLTNRPDLEFIKGTNMLYKYQNITYKFSLNLLNIIK